MNLPDEDWVDEDEIPEDADTAEPAESEQREDTDEVQHQVTGKPPAASDDVLAATLKMLVSTHLSQESRRAEAKAAREAKAAAAESEEVPELVYQNVEEFVNVHLTEIYKRDVGPTSTYRWSAEWWRSAEAVSRLESLWRAWEALRLDPATGMSVWWRDHADHHMNVLMSTTGPFARSEPKAYGSKGDRLPCEPAPLGLFQTE